MSEKIKKYRLFFLKYSVENVDFASEHRFNRVTPDYILIYTQRARLRPPCGKCIELKGGDLSSLTDMDREWILDCGRSVFSDILAKQSKESAGKLAEMVDRLEQELAKEAEKEGAEIA